MIARLTLLLLLASSTWGSEPRPIFDLGGARSSPKVTIRESSDSTNCPLLEISYERQAGHFGIPLAEWVISDSSGAKVVVFDDVNGRHRIYQNSAENLEWELVLPSRPLENWLALPIESFGLDYYYQPPLSTEEIVEGVERADSVVGSYAVYHHPDREGQSSKAFHIYRPRAWSADGDTVWCGLSVNPDANVLLIDVPARFLVSAKYPVTIDPTFGFSSVGASTAPMIGTICYAGKLDTHSASTGDRVVQYHAYLRGVGDGSIDMAVYDMSSGVPVNRLASPIVLSVSGSAYAVLHSSATVSQSLVNGSTYCVAMGAEQGDIRYAFDAVDAAVSVHTGGGALPVTWSEGETTGRRISIFVAYEEGQTPETLIRPRRRKLSDAMR